MSPLPLDNTIISAPLARNAKFHSPLLLSVRQSKLREGTEAPAESEPTMIPHQIPRIHSPTFTIKNPFKHYIFKKKIIFAHLGGAALQAEVPNVSARVHISIKIDHVKSIRRDRLWPHEEGASVSPRSPRRPF